MKKLLLLLCIICAFNSCSDSDLFNQENSEASDVPHVRSYVTYTTENTVKLNGFIDNSNNYYQGSDLYTVGFIFRTGDPDDSSNDQIILVDEEVPYQASMRTFSADINALEPNTTYYYTCFTRNGPNEKFDWEEFTTSDLPCNIDQNNYVNIFGSWESVYVELIEQPICCEDGNVGIRFGNWPNIIEANFNELNDGYPITAQYFGVDYAFDISNINRELVKSTNQVLIGSRSTPETEIFVNNDGETVTVFFCNTILRDGNTLNGKVSFTIP